MGTLGGLATHSAPTPPTPAPALRAASPTPPALWLRRAKPDYANAISWEPWEGSAQGTRHLPPPRFARPRQPLPRSGTALPRLLRLSRATFKIYASILQYLPPPPSLAM